MTATKKDDTVTNTRLARLLDLNNIIVKEEISESGQYVTIIDVGFPEDIIGGSAPIINPIPQSVVLRGVQIDVLIDWLKKDTDEEVIMK